MNISRFSRACSEALGSPKAFITAVTVILLWAATGPMFHFGQTWQLIINTSTTIFTFFAMFLLQHSQNADTKAVHLKLDELIIHIDDADNRFAHIEKMDSQELSELELLHEKEEQDARRQSEVSSTMES